MSDDIKKNRFFELRFNGNNISSAAGTLGVSYATAKRWNKDLESVVKSENIKKTIESSILSAFSRFENYSNLLSAEFAKLQTDSQKYDSVSLYFEDRMNFLLKIIHMDRRLNNSMLNLLKMNKHLAAPPPDVQSSFDNLQFSIDDDKLNAFMLSENEKIKTETPVEKNNAEPNIEDNNDVNPDEDSNEYLYDDNSDDENNEETSEEENPDEDNEENDEDNNEDIPDENNNEETPEKENREKTPDEEKRGKNDSDSSDDAYIKEIIKKEYSNGISIAEYEGLLKRISPLKEAEQIMKKESKSRIRHGGSMYKPKQEDSKNSAESKPDEKSMSHNEP